MPRFLANRFVELCGIASSLITTAIVIAIEQWFDFSIFTLTFWVVVPVGALLTGAAAASGYYLGAVLANRRPTRGLLVHMIAVAAGTFLLIYYVDYRLLATEDGTPVSQFVSFGTFLQVVLTKAEYGLMRHGNAKIEVGAFGYVIGALQFLAFACGGFVLYLGLTSKAFCERCSRYLKQIAEHEKTFVGGTDFDAYAQRLYTLSPPAADYFHILKEPHEAPKPKPGAMQVHWSLLSCTACGDQILTEAAKVLGTRDGWQDVPKLKRTFPIPASMPLLPELRAAKEAKTFAAPRERKV